MLHHLTTRQKVIVMLAVMSGLFLAALDQTIVSTALPKILTEFNALSELSWVVTAYLLTSTVAVPIAGKLSDLYGRRKLLLTGIVIFVIASLLCGAAQNIQQLIAFRALQGLGGGILFANAFAIIGDLFNAREQGKWQGIFGAVFGLSSVVGPLLGGYLADGNSLFGIATDWRWTFLINIPVGIVAFGLIFRYMPTIIGKVKPVIDYLGAGLLTAALSCLILATSLGGTHGWEWNSPQIMGLFAGSIAGAVAFVFAERRAKDPIIPLRFFKSPVFNLISIMFLLFGMSFFGTIIYIPIFAQQVLNFSATNSGILLLPMILGLTISSVVVGQLIQKTGKYKIFINLGLLIATIGVITLSTLNPQSTYFDLSWRMALAGIGLGLAMPIFRLAVQNALPHKDLGAASSSAQLFQSVGSTVGLAIMGGALNNLLASKITEAKNTDPAVQMAVGSGQGDLSINSLQHVLSAEGQHAATANMSPQAVDAFHGFVHSMQGILSSSITQVFLLSAAVMAVAFIISFFLKELPLRENPTDDIPSHI